MDTIANRAWPATSGMVVGLKLHGLICNNDLGTFDGGNELPLEFDQISTDVDKRVSTQHPNATSQPNNLIYVRRRLLDRVDWTDKFTHVQTEHKRIMSNQNWFCPATCFSCARAEDRAVCS